LAIYGWSEVEDLTRKLAEKMDFKPDLIVGIPRGGVIPARLLARELGVKKMYFVTVVKKDGGRIVTTKIVEDLSGKGVLLVEDMLESGESLIEAKKYLLYLGAVVKTAAYFTSPYSKITPDYFIGAAREDVKFPWE